jgi:hypothetical protein
MSVMRAWMPLGAAALAAMLALSPAHAKSSGGSSRGSSFHSSSSNRSSSRSTGTHSSRVRSSGAASKSLPAGTRFIHKTCKTAACKAKHPSGEYMLPIKPKQPKGGAA